MKKIEKLELVCGGKIYEVPAGTTDNHVTVRADAGNMYMVTDDVSKRIVAYFVNHRAALLYNRRYNSLRRNSLRPSLPYKNSVYSYDACRSGN